METTAEAAGMMRPWHIFLVQLSNWPQDQNLWHKYAKYTTKLMCVHSHTLLKTDQARSVASWQKLQESDQYSESGCGTAVVSVWVRRSWMFLANAVIYDPVPVDAKPRGDVSASRLSGHRRRFVCTSGRRGREHNSCTFLHSLWWKRGIKDNRHVTGTCNGQPTPFLVSWGKTCDPTGHPAQLSVFVLSVFI